MYFDGKTKIPIRDDKITMYDKDYRQYRNAIRNVVSYEKDRTEKKVKRPGTLTPIDPESYVKLRRVPPFNMMSVPKDILRTNPHEKYQLKKLPEDVGLEGAIKTRPRIYMSPAVSMDDVPDPDMRELLCKYMYTTDFKRSLREGISLNTYKKKIIHDTTMDPIPVTYDSLSELMPELDPKYNYKGVKWAQEQSLLMGSPTEEFWKRQNVKCGACVDPLRNLVSEQQKNIIGDLISKNTLRVAHDKMSPGYAGYKPALAKCVPLKKSDLPYTHPYISVSNILEMKRMNL